MSARSPRYELVHQRLREIFGEPDATLVGRGHWTLKPAPHRAAINVLVDETAGSPVVWIFDPHSTDADILTKSINNEDDLNQLVNHILERVKRARAELLHTSPPESA